MLTGLPDFSNTDSYGTETESISRSKVTLAVIVLLLLTNHENHAFCVGLSATVTVTDGLVYTSGFGEIVVVYAEMLIADMTRVTAV